ncbi:hypothetical protein HK405_006556, partial [Cladochytrium tenue]
MSYYLKLDREHPNRVLNPLHLGFTVHESLTPPQLEARRRAWRCIVMVDSYAAVLSGFPLGVDESACAFMLDCYADDFPGAANGHELKGEGEDAGANEATTVDDRRSREATGARAWRELLEADPMARRRRPSDWTFVYQACHLLRRAWRISRQLRIRSSSLAGVPDDRGGGTAAGAAFGEENAAARAALLRGLGRPGSGSSFGFNSHFSVAAAAANDTAADAVDARALHNAVLAWLALLPPRLRGFADLADYAGPAISPPLLRQNFDAASTPALMCGLLALAALAALHLPRAGDSAARYALRPPTAAGVAAAAGRSLASSVEVLELAHRAQAALLNTVAPRLMAETSAAAGTAPADPVETATLCGDSMAAGLLFVVSMGAQAACGLAGAAVAAGAASTSPGAAAARARAFEAARTAEQVDLRALAVAGRQWPVACMFASRLKRVLKAVRVR